MLELCKILYKVNKKMNAEFKIKDKVLETKRLFLRPFRQEDLDDFYDYASVEGVGERAGWKHHESKEESQKILESFIVDDNTFAIIDKGNNKLIGSIGIEKYAREEKLSEFFTYEGREIGYVLSKEYWKKGLMTEAVKAVIDYLFLDLDLDFLLCGYRLSNKESKRVQEKCGFKPYRKIKLEDYKKESESGILTLLLNPKKDIKLNFSNFETLIYKE